MDYIVTIEYCDPCNYKKQSVQLAEEIKDRLGGQITQVIIKPTQSIGSFEVSIGQELIFSKKNSGRLPHPGEIIQLLMKRLFK